MLRPSISNLSTPGVATKEFVVGAVASRHRQAQPVPFYLQVAEQIVTAIRKGILAQGDRLGNELALSRQYGLSRGTLRNVMTELAGKRLIVRRRGIGTQVVSGQPWFEQPRGHLSGNARTSVLANELMPASVQVAAALIIRPGTRVLYRWRLRFLDGEPIGV